jgi:hypothetical protein
MFVCEAELIFLESLLSRLSADVEGSGNFGVALEFHVFERERDLHYSLTWKTAIPYHFA